jgi:hypothetical protein
MTLDYVHEELNEEVQARAGYYAATDELRLKLDGREVLCIVGVCIVDSSCCGSRSFRYALVPGYLVTWKGKKDKLGRMVSEVEPITDKAVKERVEAILKDTQVISETNIEFW